eukprot:CAMPEP_0170579392 /NCGR_PEP_ID=MMETSP0224-20130122/5960_1 /TAXON_ID=285029 /ORGANISM="Togula jolla, Strain CCCM 725" /LENGTH=631 /DNA_ID=CAMNT_0010902415 /DNA_START=71 /DNA_END=1966 /DNA_ORIENTATION=-
MDDYGQLESEEAPPLFQMGQVGIAPSDIMGAYDSGAWRAIGAAGHVNSDNSTRLLEEAPPALPLLRPRNVETPPSLVPVPAPASSLDPLAGGVDAKEPRLLDINDLLPDTMSRVETLERVIVGQQAQLNAFLPLHRELLAMHMNLCEQQEKGARELMELRQAHEALHEEHHLLRRRLSQAGIAEPDFPGGGASSSRVPFQRMLQEKIVADLVGKAAGHIAKARLLVASRSCESSLSGRRLQSSLCFSPRNSVASPWKDRSSPVTNRRYTSPSLMLRLARQDPDPPLPLPHEVYAIGGHEATDGNPSNVVERFTNKWEAVEPMRVARVEHRVATLGGVLYVVGGTDGYQCLRACERYDRTAGRWEVLPNMLGCRRAHAVSILDGTLCVSGGCSGTDAESTLSSCEQFAPTWDRWEALPPMTSARHGHTSVALGGKLYVVSGANDGRPLAACERLSMARGVQRRWERLPPLSASWSGLSAAVVSEKLYVVASFHARRVPSACERFDPATSQWELLPRNALLHSCETIAEAAGKLYVFGRLSHQKRYGVCQCFNPATHQWEQMPPPLTQKSVCNALAVGGSLYLAGPVAAAAEDRSSFEAQGCTFERLDPTTCHWEALPPARQLQSQVVGLIVD